MADEDENISKPALLQDREVLFLDFLGFSDAVKTWERPRQERLISLLVSIAAAQSSFDISGEALADGSYKIKGRADITTFSDNIVMSYPLLARPESIDPDVWPVIANGWEGMVRGQMQDLAAQVAMAGLELGLLVRGGLSRGTLYHSGNVVMGEAMIDAYLLEREGAGSARIVVSDRIAGEERLYIDSDGKRCLDLLTPLMLLARERHGDAEAWAKGRLDAIDVIIAGLTSNGREKEARTWTRFRDELRYVRETWS